MSKFKSSTHQEIDQIFKELHRPMPVAGKTYRLRGRGGEVLERPVVSVSKTHMIYLRNGVETKCQVKTFQRMWEEHGIRDGGEV
ncbi:hypothetical protein WMW72_10800 [Paenibacillus filicis]|uniref:Type II toxin-antitoxin system HicA family toxin n=1 Tax=Paenibacillus filicis TaxID=669464 RepID=A0ABU9DHQ7_9BACL